MAGSEDFLQLAMAFVGKSARRALFEEAAGRRDLVAQKRARSRPPTCPDLGERTDAIVLELERKPGNVIKHVPSGAD